MKKIFALLLCLGLLASMSLASTTENTGSVDTTINNGLSIGLPCNPASVSNGSVNPNTCVITCNSGYALSGTSCNIISSSSSSSSSGGGGGGGGGSTIDTVTPYILPNVQMDKVLELYRPLNLSKITNGILPRDIKFYNYYQGYSVFFTKGTKITYEDGTIFTGILEVPVGVALSNCPKMPNGLKLVKAFKIGSRDGKKLIFKPPFTMTIPVKFKTTVDADQVKTYYYDDENEKYKLAGDGGELSEDQTYITVEVDHMTLFVVAYTGSTSTDSNIIIEDQSDKADYGNDEIFKDFFRDTKNHWGAEYVKALYEKGVFTRKDQFFPDTFTTRAELAKTLVEAFEVKFDEKDINTPFIDVDKNQWYASYIKAGYKAGIIKGYADGTFRPSDQINRAEALVMILRATGVSEPVGTTNFTDVADTDWFAPFVGYAVKKGIVNGRTSDTFVPSGVMTRSEMAKIVYKSLDL